MKKLLLVIIALLVVSLTLIACNGDTTTTTSTSTSTTTSTTSSTSATTTTTTTQPTASDTPKSGGILTMRITADPSSFYPPTMTGQTDGQTSMQALETLFRLDEKMELVPLLALSYVSDATEKTVTITLRQGVKFHDGSDFNAEVCKWNLDQYRQGNRAELKKVTSVDVVDEYTVRLNLSEFDNTLITNLSNVADAGRMISKQSFEENGGAEWAANNPVGTGPFKFVSATKDVGVTWERFDGYWAGKPYLDGIEQKRYGDDTVALMEFKSGNLNILGTLNARDAKTLESEPDKYVVSVPPQGQVPALAGYALDPNSPFADLKVRQAMSYAVNVQEYNAAFGLGYWMPQNQWAVPGTWGYSNDVVAYPYNPEKAKELLAEAGYADGFDTVLNFFNTGQSIVDENVALQGYLTAVGIRATLNPLQRPAFSDMASNSKGWEGIVRQQGFSSPDPLIKYANVIAGNEFTGTYLNDEIRDLYDQAITAADFETKQQLTHELMEMLVDKYCIATYLSVNSSPIVRSTVVRDSGFGPTPYFYLSPFTWLDK